MEKEQLTLEMLCSYLPYGLEWKRTSLDIEDIGTINESDIVIPSMSIIEHYIKNNNKHFSTKPIFRNLQTDLTREIEHNGEKFVPMVELAKLEFDDPNVTDVSTEIQEDDYSINIEYLPSWYSLTFHKANRNFSRWDDGEGISPVKNEILQKLFSWHFWIYDQSYFEKKIILDINELNK